MVRSRIKTAMFLVVTVLCILFCLKYMYVYWDDPMLFIKYAKPEELQNPYIHKHQYDYAINNASLCDGKVFLLIFVPSHPLKAKERNLVRQTWGTTKYVGEERIVLVFGTAELQDDKKETKDVNAPLKAESNKYHDIIQGNFIDKYDNLTYKTIMAFHWVTNYCKSAKYYLKTDDDTIPNLFKYIKAVLSSTKDLKKVMFCSPNDSKPHRPTGRGRQKWHISRKSYFPNLFPIYCAGPSYMMSTDVLSTLYDVSKEIPFLFLEDVYVGLCRMRAGVEISQIDYVKTSEEKDFQFENFQYAYFFIMDKFSTLAQWKHLWTEITSAFKNTNLRLS